MYLLSANLGEIGLLVGASLLGKPLPLSAVQILYVNLATDGLPALALSVDPPERDLMRRPPRRRGEGIFTRPVVALIADRRRSGRRSSRWALFTWALSADRTLGRGDDDDLRDARADRVLQGPTATAPTGTRCSTGRSRTGG